MGYFDFEKVNSLRCLSPVGHRGILCLFIAALLFFAALMKTWQLATAQYGGVGLFFDPLFILFVTFFEISFAAWLLTGILTKQTWVATIGLFTLFLLISLSKALSGASTCGCLGVLRTNPWVMVFVDSAIIAVLFCGCRKIDIESSFYSKKRLQVIILLWGAACLSAFVAFLSVRKDGDSLIGIEYERIDGRKTILVTPSQWPKDKCPLLPYIEPEEITDRLKSGKWRIVIFKHDCPECRILLKGMETEEDHNLLFLEVPPYGRDNIVPKGFIQAKLTDSVNWLIRTPVIIDFSAEEKDEE